MPTDPQPGHGNDDEARNRAFEAHIADPARGHRKNPALPDLLDEEVTPVPPPWAEDAKHPGPPGWHREADPNEPSGFHWVED